jgi:hypothetical protein
MSERKYRQRGYQDEPRPGPREHTDRPKGEATPREMRRPNMPGFREVVRCARCGHTITSEVTIDARCNRCGSDLHACSQCTSFDPGRRFECMQPITARVSPKDARNDCTLFEPRTVVERETGSTRPNDARKAFDDLFG